MPNAARVRSSGAGKQVMTVLERLRRALPVSGQSRRMAMGPAARRVDALLSTVEGLAA